MVYIKNYFEIFPKYSSINFSNSFDLFNEFFSIKSKNFLCNSGGIEK